MVAAQHFGLRKFVLSSELRGRSHCLGFEDFQRASPRHAPCAGAGHRRRLARDAAAQQAYSCLRSRLVSSSADAVAAVRTGCSSVDWARSLPAARLRRSAGHLGVLRSLPIAWREQLRRHCRPV